MPRKTKEQLEQERLEREREFAKQKEERRKQMPEILFNLMLRASKMSQHGHSVSFEMIEENSVAMVHFQFDNENDRYGRKSEILTLESEEWEVEMVERMLNDLEEKEREEQRQRALAAEAKARLTPEQLEALRKYG